MVQGPSINHAVACYHCLSIMLNTVLSINDKCNNMNDVITPLPTLEDCVSIEERETHVNLHTHTPTHRHTHPHTHTHTHVDAIFST